MVNNFLSGYLELRNSKNNIILKITIFTSAIFLLILLSSISKYDPDHTRFVSFGHTYKFLDYPKVMPQLVERINAENPDYVIVLGDVVWLNLEREWEAVNKLVKSINAEVLHTPGNHDIYSFGKRDTMDRQIENLQTELLPKYRERWGYDKKIVTDRNATLTLINSLDEAAPNNKFLQSIQSSLSDERPNFLFTHHQIWDSLVRTNASTTHEKAFHFRDISDNLRSYDFIITSGAYEITERMIPHVNPVITAGIGSGYLDGMYLVVDIYPDKVELEAKTFKIVGESDEEMYLILDEDHKGGSGRNTKWTATKKGDRWVLQ